MGGLLTELGVGGILVILVLREVFGFLRSRADRDTTKSGDVLKEVKAAVRTLDVMLPQITKLYDWHNRMDDDGVPVWYVRKSLEAAVEKLALVIDKMGDVLKTIHDGQMAMRKDLAALRH